MIYSMGEMLIDFMQEGSVYVPYPGGAPANVAIHAKKAGADARFVGKFSRDNFGFFLKQTVDAHDVRFKLSDSDKATALALVSHKDGERAFQFYRNDTADLNLSVADIDKIDFKEKDILHFCSLGLVPEGTSYEAHLHAMHQCKKAHGMISFDVNLRERLWQSLELAKKRVLECIEHSDIVKVNEEELFWLSDTHDIQTSMIQLQTKKQVILCTMGSAGSTALLSDGSFINVKGLSVNQVDSTGAGDSYSAMVLVSLSHYQGTIFEWQHESLKEALDYATWISAQVVTKQGATPDIQYVR